MFHLLIREMTLTPRVHLVQRRGEILMEREGMRDILIKYMFGSKEGRRRVGRDFN